MSGSGSDRAPAGLSAEERARLRPGVDAAALERLLARLPDEAARRAAVLHFAREVTLEDVRALLAEAGETDALRDLERSLAEPPPRSPLHPARGPGTVAYRVVPTDWFGIRVSPPEDPALRALWEAVEPGGPGGPAPAPGAA